jgi:hypothetical protein
MIASPQLNPQQIEAVSAMVADFIQQQRDIHLQSATLLDDSQRRVFSAFFPESILNNTRFTAAKLADPPFYPELRKMGFTNLPKSAEMAATTYIDVIAAQEKYSDRLRFHELVHAVQYQELGLQKFAAFYVNGFLRGGGYFGIPLERNAYELEERFATQPNARIDVLAEVRRWIGESRF